jgi:hypothetical protein
VATPTGSPSPAALPDTLSIILTQPYTDTQVSVTAGETITITASGTLMYATASECPAGDTCQSTPAGEATSNCSNPAEGPFTAPTLNCWSLIGKIGVNGTPFEVGDSLTITASTSGTLYLGVNDDDYNDNSGTWTATISN